MRKLFSIALFLMLALPVLGQSKEVTLGRFSVNQSATLNYFQSPQYLYGNVEVTFAEGVTAVDIAVKVQDGTGKPIDGTAIVKHWNSAAAGQKLEFDYTYYNPSAVQEFKPVLVVTAKGPNGTHIQQTFQPKGQSGGGDGIGY